MIFMTGFGMNGCHFKSKYILIYDFSGFDMELIDFFEMRLTQDEDKVRVSLNGKTLTIQ